MPHHAGLVGKKFVAECVKVRVDKIYRQAQFISGRLVECVSVEEELSCAFMVKMSVPACIEEEQPVNLVVRVVLLDVPAVDCGE